LLVWHLHSSLLFPYPPPSRSPGPADEIVQRDGEDPAEPAAAAHDRRTAGRETRERRHVDDDDQRPGEPHPAEPLRAATEERDREDRKSTRLNSSHGSISYAVF